MKSIIERAGRAGQRRFISPSLSSDMHTPANLSFDWKTPAALIAGAWFFKRYPKTAILGLIATGIYYGVTSTKETNPFRGEGIVKDLH